MLEGIFSAFGALLMVAVVLALAWWVTRRIAGGTGLKIQSRYMKIIDKIIIGQDRSILIIQIGDNYYVAGVTAANISLLAELKADMLESLSDDMDTRLPEFTFKELFQKIGGRKNDGE